MIVGSVPICCRRHVNVRGFSNEPPVLGNILAQALTHTHQTHTHTHLHLADAFIQSDLHCIQVTVSTFFFYQLLLSLGIEPMILALVAPFLL